MCNTLWIHLQKIGEDTQQAADVVMYVVINQVWKEKTFAALRRRCKLNVV